MDDNNNNEQFFNFTPYPGYVRGQFLPQNPHYLFDPITGMYLQQYSGQSGYLNSQMYYYRQQQQYQQVQIQRQHLQAPELTQGTHAPFSYSIPRVLLQPLPGVGACPLVNPRNQSHSKKSQTQQQQFWHGASEEEIFQNTQVQPEYSDQKCATSDFYHSQKEHNYGSSRSDSHHIPHSQPNVTENNQGVVKQEEEEEQSLNEKEIQVSAEKIQNNENKSGQDPHKKIKMEDDKNHQHNQLSRQSCITKKGLNHKNNSLINQLQTEIQLEEPVIPQCKQEIEETEEDQVCQYEENDKNCNQNAVKEKTVLQDLSKQGEEIHLNQENNDENLRSSQQINQSKRTIESRNNCYESIVVRKKENKSTMKKVQKNIQNSLNSPDILKVTSQSNRPRDDQTQEIEEDLLEMQIFYDSLSEDNYNLIQQLMDIKVQNCFKNVINGFMQTVNKKFKKIYIYKTPNNEALVGHNLKTLEVISVEEPTSKQKAKFSQKFNKYFNDKSYNTRSIGQIVKNTLYSKILSDFLDNYSDDWLRKSELSNKEDNQVFLRFLQLSIKDNSNLCFL